MLPSLTDSNANVTRFQAVLLRDRSDRRTVALVVACLSLRNASFHAPREAAGS